MRKKTTIPLSIFLSLLLNLAVTVINAGATKISAPPLPHEDADNENSQAHEDVIPPSGTRWNRKADYRESAAEDAKKAAEATKKAEEAHKQELLEAQKDAQKSKQEQLANYQKNVQTAVEENNRAVALGKQGLWLQAIQAHEKAVQYDPSNKQFRINLSAARTAYGEQLFAKGDTPMAITLFRKALASAPDNGLAGRLLVKALRKAGYDPSSAETRMKLGDQLTEAGDTEQALVEYNAALELEPSARAYIKMGDMAYRYGQFAQATNYYREASVKDPDCAAAYRQIGFLQLASHDYTSAAASLRTALIHDPNDVAAGQALIELWRKQVAASPNAADNHLGLAGALQLTHDFVGAQSEYAKVEALDSNNPGLKIGVVSLAHAIQSAKAEKNKTAAQALFNEGLKQEALAEINEAVMLEPRNAAYQFLLGQCLEAVGDYKAAHEAYLTAITIDPVKNKEAARRLRLMQSYLGSSAGAKPIGEKSSQSTSVKNTKRSNSNLDSKALSLPSSSAFLTPDNQSRLSMSAAAKNVFEGGSGAGDFANSHLAFRTHDESQPSDSRTSVDTPADDSARAHDASSGNAVAGAGLNDVFSKLTDLESQHDYAGAADLIRQILPNNLQSPDLHHRLAIDLMAQGDLNEAVSEFRIASALSANNTEYAGDLARALSAMKNSDNAASRSEAGAGADSGSIAGHTDDNGASK